METALVTTGLVGAVGVDIVKTAFHSAVTALQTTLHFIKDGSNENELFERVQSRIKDFDLDFRFKLAQTYVDTCPEDTITQYLVASIHAINNLSEKIRIKITNHKNLWFHRYRFCDIEGDLAALDKEVSIFEKRLKIIGTFLSHK